ncbi:MAG TPA: hypothetical protein VKH35_09510 [Thermoanaerobaculia bacterium]|nr:hypothetical protein [Thermoanaerobaculia bacterium]
MPDPKSQARAAILAGVMAVEPAAIDPFSIRTVPVRRVLPRITPPLNLEVIPFRYRVLRDGRIEPVHPECGHERPRPGARSRR